MEGRKEKKGAKCNQRKMAENFIIVIEKKKKKNQARASIKTFLGLQENSTLQVINGTISVSMELSLQRT